MRFMAIVFVWIILFVGTAGASNLIVGGGFEDPIIPSGTSYLLSVNPEGWSGTGDIVEQGYAGAVSSGDGNQWFDLNPGSGSGTGISQSLSLHAGTPYLFSFLYNGSVGGSTNQITYSLASTSETILYGSVSTSSMDVFSGTSWNSFSTVFTPLTNNAAMLSFTPDGTIAGGFIDAVNISIVPEPVSSALFIIGGATLGFRHFRKKFKK